MTTVKLVLKKQQKKDGTYPILIRLTTDRKSQYISTGYSVKQSQFIEGNENWVVRHPDRILINAALESKRSDIMSKIITADIEGKPFDMEAKTEETFFAMVKRVIANYEARKQVASFNRLSTNLVYLKEAWKHDVLMSAVSSEWVEKYVNYRYKKGNGTATVKKNLMDLGVVFNVAQTGRLNVFSEYAKTLNPPPPQIDKLSQKEVKLLEVAPLDGLADVARDMFLFSAYCNGMRFESVAIFHPSMIRDGAIRYRMNKGKKLREITIFPQLQVIIEKYIHAKTLYLFPVVKKVHNEWTKKDIIGTANSLVNNYLQRAAILAGINPKIHFHMARHSFANIAKQKKIGTNIIKDALGHSTYAMTEKYLNSLSDDEINEGTKGMWD